MVYLPTQGEPAYSCVPQGATFLTFLPFSSFSSVLFYLFLHFAHFYTFSPQLPGTSVGVIFTHFGHFWTLFWAAFSSILGLFGGFWPVSGPDGDTERRFFSTLGAFLHILPIFPPSLEALSWAGILTTLASFDLSLASPPTLFDHVLLRGPCFFYGGYYSQPFLGSPRRRGGDFFWHFLHILASSMAPSYSPVAPRQAGTLVGIDFDLCVGSAPAFSHQRAARAQLQSQAFLNSYFNSFCPF